MLRLGSESKVSRLWDGAEAFFDKIYVPRVDVHDGDELGVVDSKHIDGFGPQVDAGERAWCTARVTEAGDLLGVWILEAVVDVLVDELEAACRQKASQYIVGLGVSYKKIEVLRAVSRRSIENPNRNMLLAHLIWEKTKAHPSHSAVFD